MAGPPRAVAVVRHAVRPGLRGSRQPVLAACSGGADSVALDAALGWAEKCPGAQFGVMEVRAAWTSYIDGAWTAPCPL